MHQYLSASLWKIAVVLTIAFWLIAGFAAVAAGLPEGATCDLVRQYVAQHGKVKALAWAIKQGYSFAQIREAKQCLR